MARVRPRPQANSVLLAVLVGAVAAAVHAPTIGFELVNWDDPVNVAANPLLARPSLAALARIWSAPYEHLYIPVVYTSYMFDRLLSPGDWMIHVGNVALHAVNAILVLFLVRRILAAGGLAAASFASAAGALVFALHPLQVESVAWATGRKDLLCGFFVLAALHSHLGYRAAEGAARRAQWYAAATAAFALALLSKPTAVALPAAALAVDFLVLRAPLRASAAALLPWALVSLAAVAITGRVQMGEDAAGLVVPAIWQRPFVAADALVFYASKVVAPFQLAAVYARQPALVLARPVTYVYLPLVIVAMFFLFRRRGIVALAAAMALVFLAPVLGLVPFSYQRYSTVADRYMYMPLAGVALAAAWGVGVAESRVRAARPVAAALLVLLAALTLMQQRHWRNSEALWLRCLAFDRSKAAPLAMLANVYAAAGDFDKAEPLYREAVRAEPGSAMAHLKMGEMYARVKRPREAAAAFEEAIRIDKSFSDAHCKYGLFLFEEGRMDAARQHLEAAVRIAPSSYTARYNLGVLLKKTGQTAAAVPHLEEAVRLGPESISARFALGTALHDTGDAAGALLQFERILAVDPGHANAAHNMVGMLIKLGRGDEAALRANEIMRSNPQNTELAGRLQQMLQRAAGRSTR